MTHASGPDLSHVRRFILSFAPPTTRYFRKSEQISELAKEQCLQDSM